MQTIRDKTLEKKIYTAGFAALILIYIAGCASLWVRPATRLELCWLIKGTGGKVLDSYPNPDGSFIIRVVKPDCGQTAYWGEIYNCSTRLDLESNHRVISNYEMGGECDASVKWINNIQFEVTFQSGTRREMDIPGDFGIMP